MARIKSELIKRLSTSKTKALNSGAGNTDGAPAKKRRMLKKSRDRRMDKEIRVLQRSPNNMICKAPLKRLCQEIVQTTCAEFGLGRFSGEALKNLQLAGESYLENIFQEAYVLTTRIGNRQTLALEEFKFVVDQHEKARQRFNGAQYLPSV